MKKRIRFSLSDEQAEILLCALANSLKYNNWEFESKITLRSLESRLVRILEGREEKT